MCLNVFTVYMPLSVYVMRAIDMLFNKRPITYLLTYLFCLIVQNYCLLVNKYYHQYFGITSITLNIMKIAVA